jgi:hypothetical protein
MSSAPSVLDLDAQKREAEQFAASCRRSIEKMLSPEQLRMLEEMNAQYPLIERQAEEDENPMTNEIKIDKTYAGVDPTKEKVLRRKELMQEMGWSSSEYDRLTHAGMPSLRLYFTGTKPGNGYLLSVVKQWLADNPKRLVKQEKTFSKKATATPTAATPTTTDEPLTFRPPKTTGTAQQDLRPPKVTAKRWTTPFNQSAPFDQTSEELFDDVKSCLDTEICHCTTGGSGFVCSGCKSLAALEEIEKRFKNYKAAVKQDFSQERAELQGTIADLAVQVQTLQEELARSKENQFIPLPDHTDFKIHDIEKENLQTIITLQRRLLEVSGIMPTT